MTISFRRPATRHLATAATVSALALAGITPALASAVQDAYHAHTRLCLKLFFADKPAHDIQCLPNMSTGSPAHAGGDGGSPAPVPVIVPAPPVVPPVVVPPVVPVAI